MSYPAGVPVRTGIDGKASAAGRRSGYICNPVAVGETLQ
jgi:hypothetical protein